MPVSSWSKDYDLWVAHYNVPAPRLPKDWLSFKIHQYTSSGSVNGISGRVDMNNFMGTEAELRKYAGLESPEILEINASKEVDKIIINLV